MSDYLWDRSGDPDPEVERLEHALQPLRFRPEPVLTLPEPEAAARRRPWWRTVAMASATAAAAAALTWWLVRPPRDDAVLVEKELGPIAELDPQGTAEAEVGAPIEGDLDEVEHEREAEENEDDEDEVEEIDDGPARDRPSKSGKRRSKSSKRSKSSGSSSAASSSSKSSSSSKADNLDVDCILNPDLGKCRSGGASKSGGSADPSLPEKLTTSEIKAGVNTVKDVAKACGPRHGAKPGTRVSVKLSIAGATGTVTSASAQAPHGGTPLGRCVAAALKQATFKRFQKSSIGVVYPIRL